ncbi:MAG: cation:dicarboxylate symporter family transporter, partial [Wohlfahrtiimonas sp.]
METTLHSRKFKFSLGVQIMIALAFGIIVGSILHGSTNQAWVIDNILNPAGQIFIKMIQMIVVPIVISTLIVGIAGVGDTKKLGKLGLKTIIYFEVVTTIAIVLGIFLANVFQPGVGINMQELSAVDISSYQATTAAIESSHHGIADTLLSI